MAHEKIVIGIAKIKTDKKLQQKELYEVRIESVNPDGSVIGCLI